MENDNLSGRELDALVAQRVFGFRVEERRNARTGEKDFIYALSPEAPNGEWVRVPFYSFSLAASIQVQVELQKKGWSRQEVRAGSHWKKPGGVRVVLVHTDGRTFGALGSENEALCRAALEAVTK